jgi:CheY-like chemotaxis protein
MPLTSPWLNVSWQWKRYGKTNLEASAEEASFLPGSEGCFMPLTLILSVGLDPELLDSRNRILQSSGYTVVSAYSIKEAVDRFQAGDFDLVLLCQSVPAKERDRLTCWIRASGSRIPVVFASGKLRPGDAFSAGTADGDPAALLVRIREALIKTAIPAAWTAAFRVKQEVVAGPGKKPPASGNSREQQKETASKHLVPLARTG